MRTHGAGVTDIRVKRPDIVKLSIPFMLSIMIIAATACNEKTDPADNPYGADSSVAVTSFKLKANSGVLNKLDTLFFSIDLDKGVIFNADSLPMGTRVTDLVPVITYPSTVREAVIIMEGGEKRIGEIDYLHNPSDTVDFSGKVSLRLTAQDNITTRTYSIKLNVHHLPSDTLMWDDLAGSRLPSRYGSPLQQKSVKRDNKVYSMVRENNGALTLAISDNPGAEAWHLQDVTQNADFDVRSFAATADSFYMLDRQGSLYTSADAKQWSDTGRRWVAIIGDYDGTLMGVGSSQGTLRHVYYPDTYPETELEEHFPVSGFSNVGIFHNKWSQTPVALLSGGVDAEGNICGRLWAFDGHSWAALSQGGPNDMSRATLIPYYSYRSADVSWMTREYSVWLLIGGVDAEGTTNRTVWLSYDNGVRWQQAVDYMQLPEAIPAMYDCDGIVLDVDKSASLSDYWKVIPSRRLTPWMVKGTVDGDSVSWQCPYIYLFGGIDADGHLNDTLWRGVLSRLTFTPMI